MEEKQSVDSDAPREPQQSAWPTDEDYQWPSDPEPLTILDSWANQLRADSTRDHLWVGVQNLQEELVSSRDQLASCRADIVSLNEMLQQLRQELEELLKKIEKPPTKAKWSPPTEAREIPSTSTSSGNVKKRTKYTARKSTGGAVGNNQSFKLKDKEPVDSDKEDEPES